MMESTSPYQIHWIEFRAVSGIVTKHDSRIIKRYNTGLKNGTKVYEHFANKQAALEYLNSHDFSCLNKKYEVRICSDKQFGDSVNGEIKFTAKQENEMFII